MPTAASLLGITFILFSLAFAISSIFKKLKQAKNPSSKIAKDVLILLITLLLIIFLGRLEIDSIDIEIAAIDAIATGKSREEVADLLNGKFSFRMKEVEILVANGYSYTVDRTTQMIHWASP